jgi:hypothetical protein
MLTLLCAVVLMGCTVKTPIHYTDGQPALLIECGAATSISVCYREANAACPTGYSTLHEDHGFNRKTLTVRCR